MKLFTFFLAICCVLFCVSCMDRMDIHDEVEGTPTRIDTLVKRNYTPPVKKEAVKKEEPAESE